MLTSTKADLIELCEAIYDCCVKDASVRQGRVINLDKKTYIKKVLADTGGGKFREVHKRIGLWKE